MPNKSESAVKKRPAAFLLAVLGLAAAHGLQAQFVFFPTTEPFNEPAGVCSGPDGNVWFTLWGNASVPSRIGRITPTGTVTTFDMPTPNGGGGDIVAGPDGNLWFLEGFAGRVGRVSPTGAMTEFPIPGSSTRPAVITVGPDGALWFSDWLRRSIWRVSLSGAFIEYPLAGSPLVSPNGLATGSDGNLWFTESGAYRLGRMTTSGALTLFSRPSQELSLFCARGPDGNVWYPTFGRSFGRITPSGAIKEFPVSGAGNVTSVAAGPDGNLWMPVNEDFICPGICGPDTAIDGVIRVSTDGVQTRYELPGDLIGEISKITAGPEGSMWLTARGGLIRFYPSQLSQQSSVPMIGGFGRAALLTLLALAGSAALRR